MSSGRIHKQWPLRYAVPAAGVVLLVALVLLFTLGRRFIGDGAIAFIVLGLGVGLVSWGFKQIKSALRG